MCMVLVEDIWDKARGEFGIGGDCEEDEACACLWCSFHPEPRIGLVPLQSG